MLRLCTGVDPGGTKTEVLCCSELCWLLVGQEMVAAATQGVGFGVG